MNFLELADSRHSCRHFGGTPIEPDKMNRIYEAIRLAPSAGNLQAYAVRVATDQKLKDALAMNAHNQKFIADAPVVLVFFTVPVLSAAKYRDRGMHLYCVQDATIACTYAHLAATDLGLSSCWVGAFDVYAVERCMNAHWSWRAVAMLPIGYSATNLLTSPPKSDKVQVYDSKSGYWLPRLF